ncbi:hypothetical protein NM688_g3658 [Phlebia brevispora]|uniref:Uncharacterized protein n=1 Tax=Phlebia brevispora TaxID=194682 RepID=A0ACC1T4W9_9APHY|nr:hypothetical protein NM688_g3658 [Phlebia brevispora]
MAASPSDPAIAAAYEINLVYNYSVFAALTVVSYEFCLTFADEYKCDNSSLEVFSNVLFELPTFILAAFSALRVFALLGRDYRVATCVFLLGLAPVVLNLYQSSQVTWYYIDDPVLGPSCYYQVLKSSSFVFETNVITAVIRLKYSTATLAGVLCTITADIISIVITWIKTYLHVREASSVGIQVGFGATLLEYAYIQLTFTVQITDPMSSNRVLCIVNLTGGFTMLIPALQSANPVSPFTYVLPNIMLSRFLLNLRQARHRESGDLARFSQFSAPNFRMPSLSNIIGNLGEPLAAAGEDILEDEPRVDAEIREDCDDAFSSSGGEEQASGVLYPVDVEIEEVLRESV